MRCALVPPAAADRAGHRRPAAVRSAGRALAGQALAAAALFAALGLVQGGAQAAPQDALLSATGPDTESGAEGPDATPRVDLEWGRDVANDRVDVLGLRSRSAYAGTQVGNYGGYHLQAGFNGSDWRGEMAFWRRELQDRGDRHDLRSWQAGWQQRLTPARRGAAPSADLALRLSAWGNRSGTLTRSTGAGLVADTLNAQLTQLQLKRQRDRQLQLDLIGSRSLGQGWLASLLGGVGDSRVTNDGVSARANVAGCPYQFTFGAQALLATPDAGCQNAPILSVPNSLLPYDAAKETTWRARWAHVGGSLRVRQGAWSAALGYEVQRWWRRDIDDLITVRGGQAYRSNQTLMAQIGWAPMPSLQWLLQGQLMQHQWLSELPMAYNSLTAARFGQHYGFVTFGVWLRF